MKEQNVLEKVSSKMVLSKRMLQNIKGNGFAPPSKPNFPPPPPSIREDEFCKMQNYCMSYAADKQEMQYCMTTYPCSASFF